MGEGAGCAIDAAVDEEGAVVDVGKIAAPQVEVNIAKVKCYVGTDNRIEVLLQLVGRRSWCRCPCGDAWYKVFGEG